VNPVRAFAALRARCRNGGAGHDQSDNVSIDAIRLEMELCRIGEERRYGNLRNGKTDTTALIFSSSLVIESAGEPLSHRHLHLRSQLLLANHFHESKKAYPVLGAPP
jgi:hypothetical protein